MRESLARLSPTAAAWLRAEIAFLAERSPAGARAVVAKLRTARRNLAAYPNLGPAGLIPGTRLIVVSPYVLTIRQRGGIVEIAAIRHARQSDAYAPREALDE